MASKKIDINPALFGMKTRKNRGAKPNLSKIIAPTVNAVKNNLLKKIKEHRLKATKMMEPKKDEVEPRLVDESYDDFKEFFYPVIEGCHFGFKMDGSMKHTTDIDSSKIAVKLE